MMVDESHEDQLLVTIESALSLLKSHPAGQLPQMISSEPLPSLLAQCQAFTRADQTEAVRSIHHMAGVGGDLLGSCLAVQPNVVLISEIDPLSRLGIAADQPDFSPRSVIQQLRHSLRGDSDALILEVFQAEIAALRDALQRRGQVLVLRDHSHSHYCADRTLTERPSLYRILQEAGRLRAIVAVRHPLDSFAALPAEMTPAGLTLQDYACRYHLFLDDHRDLPIFRHEDLQAESERVTEEICIALDLDYAPGLLSLRDMVQTAAQTQAALAAAGPLRPDAETRGQMAGSEAYLSLCDRLGYDPRL